MTALKDRLVGPLTPHRDRIDGCADNQSVPFVESTWRRWLSLADIDSDVTDRVFASVGPHRVPRKQVRAMASDTGTPEGRLALLIAVLVWGRGKRNARMRDPIVQTLTQSHRDGVLASTAHLAQAGRVAEAYKAWTLPGLQAAFFTKWLWAATARRRTAAAWSSTAWYGEAWARSAGTVLKQLVATAAGQ